MAIFIIPQCPLLFLICYAVLTLHPVITFACLLAILVCCVFCILWRYIIPEGLNVDGRLLTCSLAMLKLRAYIVRTYYWYICVTAAYHTATWY